MGGRRGFTLVELLVAAAGGGLVLAAAFGLLASFARLSAAHLDRVRFAEAARVVGLVVASETRLAAPADLPDPAADTVSIRAARGFGLVCSLEGGVHVRYRGMREPDPAKDSVLVVGSAVERSLALESDRAAADGSCAADPSGRIRSWTLSDTVGPPGTVLLLFERGSYHLADGALRYRRGAGGRQPLTEARLGEDGRFGLGGDPPAMRVDIGAASAPGVAAPRAAIRTRLWNWR